MSFTEKTTTYAMVPIALFLALSCAGDPTSMDDDGATTTSPQQVSKELRAAYIAAVQRDASASFFAVPKDRAARFINPTQRFGATVADHGITVVPNDEAWELGLRAAFVGCAAAMKPVTDASINAKINRVEVRRSDLDEWYVNGPLGVEQGFVLHEPPACAGPKVVSLRVDGDLIARLDDADGDGRGDAVRFVDADDRTRLSYTDLFVQDAKGQTLRAWLSVDDEGLSIVVDDAGAAYPLVIDPLIWVEQQKLVAGDGAADDNFGQSVSLSGDTALIGAFKDDDSGAD